MTLAAPWWLLLLPFAFWLYYRKRRRDSLGVPSSQLWRPPRGGRKRFLFLLPLGRALGTALLLMALARPQAGTRQSLEVKEGIAIEMLVDVSSSMDMNMAARKGVSRTRMEAAKELVEQFIRGDGKTLHGRTDDLLGLITFARYADTRSPLTSGHDALVQIVRDLEIQDRPNEDGTAYGDALALAAARLRHMEDLQASGSGDMASEIASKVIILLTDGENNSGKHLPEEAGGLAKEWGIKVYSISLGEAGQTDGGTTVLSPSERVLDHISRETVGIFRQAGDYESLQSVYREIDQLERTRMTTRQIARVREWFWLPLLLAGCLLSATMALEATWLRTAP
ncbi:MAG: VWA domain-containing protein [Kiritimatiellae bacterium]|nr:VWA domain-containing protein [Kiritimatiellia bacterium]